MKIMILNWSSLVLSFSSLLFLGSSSCSLAKEESISVSSSSAASSSSTSTSTSGSVCTTTEYVADRGYHSPDHCSLESFLKYKKSLKKSIVHKKLLQTGYSQIPDQVTKVCPMENDASKMFDTSVQQGQDTMWFVENTMSEDSIRLAWVDRETGTEYSAVNQFRRHPKKRILAKEDPQAILGPNHSWKAIHAFEGDLFHVRDVKTNELLLQHQVGLIPIGEQPSKRQNVPPNDQIPSPQVIQDREVIRPPISRRYEWDTCNVVDVGFRNKGVEDINGYWVDTLNPDSNCEEFLKFHLGTNAHPQNFAFSKDSNTKFEKSYVGHTYVFRKALDGELVGTHTIQPTKIRACPHKTNLLMASTPQAQEIGIQGDILQGTNTTAAASAAATAATAELEQALEATAGNTTEAVEVTSSTTSIPEESENSAKQQQGQEVKASI